MTKLLGRLLGLFQVKNYPIPKIRSEDERRPPVLFTQDRFWFGGTDCGGKFEMLFV